MAEIPNRLTSLLWDRKIPDAVYAALRDERCLSEAGIERRNEALTAIAQAEAEWRREIADPGACGGTREWYIVGALMRGGFLDINPQPPGSDL